MTSLAATSSGAASSSVAPKSTSTSFNEENLMRKLDQCTPTQESIQTLALWIIHHKNHHQLIAKLWLKKMIEVNTTSRQRLTLVYLANDVIQNCKRKNAKIYQDSFKTVLNDAVASCRSESIKKNVQRVLEVWLERQVYDKQFVDQLISCLNFKSELVTRSPEPAEIKPGEKSSELEKDEIERIIAEFQAKNLCEYIESFDSFAKDLNKEKNDMEATRILEINLEHIRQYRDRNKCDKFKTEFEASCDKLDEYVHKLNQKLEKRKQLITLLKQSEIFYDAQYKDAKTVYNAYRSYGMKVQGVKKRLDELMETNFSNSNKNLETMDMEMSDDDQNMSINSSQTSTSNLSHNSNGKNQVRANLDPRRQKKDEVKKRDRSNTPVRDENPDFSSQSSNSPLDFLTKFINKTSNQNETTNSSQSTTSTTSNLSFLVNSLQKFVNNGNSSGYTQSNEFYNPSTINYQNSYLNQDSNRPGTPTKDEVYQPPMMLGQPQPPSYNPMMVPAPPPPPPPPYQMYQPPMNMIPPPPPPPMNVPGVPVPPNQLMIDPYQQMSYHTPPPGFYPSQNKCLISPSGSSQPMSSVMSQQSSSKSPKASRTDKKNDSKSDSNYMTHKRPLLSSPIISPNNKRDDRPPNRFKPYQHSHGNNNRIPTVNSQRDRLDQNSAMNNYNRSRFY